MSKYNELSDGKYFDVESQSSFEYDHVKQKASSVQSYVLESNNSDLMYGDVCINEELLLLLTLVQCSKSLLKSYSAHAQEHYANSSYGVYPTDSDSQVAILLVANKYSPNNFWNGRWRSQYLYNPASSSLEGTLKVDVHYYEDGNVRLLASKPINLSVSGGASASELIRKIAAEEKKYQEDLHRAFSQLSETAFKSLRRQLPVTRQKIEWEKISGYRLGQDIGGGRSR